MHRDYAGRASALAAAQCVTALLTQFDSRATGMLIHPGRCGSGALSLSVYLQEDGMFSASSALALSRALDTLSSVLTLALPDGGGKCIAGEIKGLVYHFDRRKRFTSRDRFDLDAGCHVLTFKSRIEIHLAPPVAEVLALLIASHHQPQMKAA